MSDTEFDIIVYGASGFTGRLVAEYMQQQYGRSVNWAMAGRSTEKLAQVRDEMGIDAATPLIAANADNEAELAAMAARTKVMITTVGPYQLYGSPLVAACVAAGTDYVDLSGEPGWMYEMIEAHDAAAKASGARIVHSCGFDSIPFDLGVYYLQQAAQEKLDDAYPGRNVRMVDARALFAMGGGIHCITQQQPSHSSNPSQTP